MFVKIFQMEEQSAVWGQGTSWLGVQATVHKGRDWFSEPGRHLAHPAYFGAFGCVWLPYSHLSSASSRVDSLLHPGRRRLLDPHFPLGAGSLGVWREPSR